MNEKITLLIEQCTTKHDSYDFEYGWTTEEYVDNEKLAYLIVKECTKHITDQQYLVETNWQCKDGIHIVCSLKEHFGVKQ